MRAILSETLADGAVLSVSRACEALALSRSTWYRLRDQRAGGDPDVALRDRIQRIASERSVYGYRRITAQLRRDGLRVNHKRVL